MSRPVTRRTALRGSLAASLGLVAGACSPAKGNAAEVPLSANDRRLVELADAYEALERRCEEHAAAHRHLKGAALRRAETMFNALTEGYSFIEIEVADTPADTLVGVLAKARVCQAPTARAFADNQHVLSVADDLWRLYKAGGLAHA